MVLRLRPKMLEPPLCCVGNGLRRPNRRLTPVVYVVQHDLHSVLKVDLGVPAKLSLDFRDVRPSTVGFARAFGNMHDFIRTQELNQAIHAVCVAAADVGNRASLVRIRRHRRRLSWPLARRR